jgi:hypothetical protein
MRPSLSLRIPARHRFSARVAKPTVASPLPVYRLADFKEYHTDVAFVAAGEQRPIKGRVAGQAGS